MMYSTNLEKISLDEFLIILNSVDLLPSRQLLLEGLSELIEAMKAKGITNLAQAQKALKNKKDYPHVSDELGVSVEYLTVLKREINSYVSKPLPLSKLELFSEMELERLVSAGLKSTRDLYERGLTPADRGELSEQLSIPLEKVITGLEMCDLLRINGVGPIYAQILLEMDIHHASDFLEVDPQVAVEAYKKINREKGYSKVDLGLKDIEYVRRFCEKLDADIQW